MMALDQQIRAWTDQLGAERRQGRRTGLLYRALEIVGGTSSAAEIAGYLGADLNATIAMDATVIGALLSNHELLRFMPGAVSLAFSMVVDPAAYLARKNGEKGHMRWWVLVAVAAAGAYGVHRWRNQEGRSGPAGPSDVPQRGAAAPPSPVRTANPTLVDLALLLVIDAADVPPDVLEQMVVPNSVRGTLLEKSRDWGFVRRDLVGEKKSGFDLEAHDSGARAGTLLLCLSVGSRDARLGRVTYWTTAHEQLGDVSLAIDSVERLTSGRGTRTLREA